MKAHKELVNVEEGTLITYQSKLSSNYLKKQF